MLHIKLTNRYPDQYNTRARDVIIDGYEDYIEVAPYELPQDIDYGKVYATLVHLDDAVDDFMRAVYQANQSSNGEFKEDIRLIANVVCSIITGINKAIEERNNDDSKTD